jgi:ectoine hydroxylase-related dioxygenase (phytanoyl-CoA dioxygenase family)
VVHFETVPGDVVVHHARTIHGAFANITPDRPRRALSIRYAGDDARFRIKPGAPQKPHHAAWVEGEPLSEPACPRVR